MNDSIAKNILVNIRALFTTNIRRRLNENAQHIQLLEERLSNIDDIITTRYHYLNILDYYARHEADAPQYQKELNYLKQVGRFCNFPYETPQEDIVIKTGFDPNVRMAYVIHKNKRLYFHEAYCEDEAEKTYRNYLFVEKLLGKDDLDGTPHQYQSPRVHVTEGDVVFDIGAAEGLFALDNIDKASHVVIVESDPKWIKPLKKTFAPYGNKVTIIQKFVSATDTETTISLASLLSSTEYSSAFVKMDIEGYELQSLSSAKDVLRQKKGTKLAVAAYHKQHDAEELKTLFDIWGLLSEFSQGYMLFHSYDTPAPPYFRHGILRGKYTIP